MHFGTRNHSTDRDENLRLLRYMTHIRYRKYGDGRSIGSGLGDESNFRLSIDLEEEEEEDFNWK